MYYLLYMDLIDIKKKKLRQKLAYLQTELQETKIIYKDSLSKFNIDFREAMTGTDFLENEIYTKIPKDPYEEIQTDSCIYKCIISFNSRLYPSISISDDRGNFYIYAPKYIRLGISTIQDGVMLHREKI